MSPGLTGRLDKLEARLHGSSRAPEHDKAERVREELAMLNRRARERPELYASYGEALDAYLDAEVAARVRGEDPEDDPEMLRAIRAYEKIERLIMNEDDERSGR